eukprot:TRINITY_DN9138_c0_g1_i1.p1 TRINITY_DN9138_c0_g1~~TRINITY_DN9138_c0_g1_i1.p1  ORF type:complete len:262 (+),score=48.14 TRINITY_DN9138_c0_g1_i1:1235-2020(+)
MGAKPRYMILTLLLPLGFDLENLKFIMEQVHTECTELGIAIIGGHTEVSSSVNKPIASATLIGEQIRSISAAEAKLGDRIVLTKSVGLEGTLILLSEFTKKICSSGVLEEHVIEDCKNELKHTLSVVKDAMLAIQNVGVTSMHDPTEGGLLNGLFEVADASGLGFEVDHDRLCIRNETKKICQFFGIDPLLLISSGALLVTVHPLHVKQLLNTYEDNGIVAHEIGEMTRGGVYSLKENGRTRSVERVVQDSLWDVLKEQST